MVGGGASKMDESPSNSSLSNLWNVSGVWVATVDTERPIPFSSAKPSGDDTVLLRTEYVGTAPRL